MGVLGRRAAVSRCLLARAHCAARGAAASSSFEDQVLSEEEMSDGRAGASGSDECWPDGTPKRFKGRDKWKNWIAYDSPFKEQSDELNRQRHYFFDVDGRGRLWRRDRGR